MDEGRLAPKPKQQRQWLNDALVATEIADELTSWFKIVRYVDPIALEELVEKSMAEQEGKPPKPANRIRLIKLKRVINMLHVNAGRRGLDDEELDLDG